MKYRPLRKIYLFLLLLMLTACPVPDVDQYSDLTREMTEAVKGSASGVIDLLEEGLAVPSGEETGIDPLLLEDLAKLQGKPLATESRNYPKELKRNWQAIFNTLDALVAYSDALAAIKDSGRKGKESFNALAGSLNNILSASGISIQGTVGQAGAYLYGKIAQIRAKNKLQDVISNADEVIQHVSRKLDSALYYMEIVNDVAKSEVLLNKPDSEEAQQIDQLYRSFIQKEKRNRVKITLLNDYENGDYESLKFFVYEDPVCLNKLGIKDLKSRIAEINATGGLSPQDRLEQISKLATTTFKTAIDDKLNNTNIVNTIDLGKRRNQIQQELNFIRAELQVIGPQYYKNIEDRQRIEEMAEINEELIKRSRVLIKSWSNYHGQMQQVLSKKQKLSLNELKLYVNGIKALKKEIDKRK